MCFSGEKFAIFFQANPIDNIHRKGKEICIEMNWQHRKKGSAIKRTEFMVLLKGESLCFVYSCVRLTHWTCKMPFILNSGLLNFKNFQHIEHNRTIKH